MGQRAKWIVGELLIESEQFHTSYPFCAFARFESTPNWCPITHASFKLSRLFPFASMHFFPPPTACLLLFRSTNKCIAFLCISCGHPLPVYSLHKHRPWTSCWDAHWGHIHAICVLFFSIIQLPSIILKYAHEERCQIELCLTQDGKDQCILIELCDQ